MNVNAPRLSIDTGLDVELPPEDMSEFEEITVQFPMASRRAHRPRATDADSGVAGLAYRPPEPLDRLLFVRGILLVVLIMIPGTILTIMLPLLAVLGLVSEHVWSQLFSFGFVIPPSLFLLALCYWRHFGPLARRRHPPRLFPGLYLLVFFLYVSLLYGLYPITNLRVIVACGSASSQNASISPLALPDSRYTNPNLKPNYPPALQTSVAQPITSQQQQSQQLQSALLSSTAVPAPSPQLCHALRLVSATVSFCCLLCFLHLLFDLALSRRVHLASRPRFADVRAEFTSAGTFLCGCCCQAIAGAVWCFVLLGWALSPRRYKWNETAEREAAAMRLARARADAEARVRLAMGIA